MSQTNCTTKTQQGCDFYSTLVFAQRHNIRLIRHGNWTDEAVERQARRNRKVMSRRMMSEILRRKREARGVAAHAPANARAALSRQSAAPAAPAAQPAQAQPAAQTVSGGETPGGDGGGGTDDPDSSSDPDSPGSGFCLPLARANHEPCLKSLPKRKNPEPKHRKPRYCNHSRAHWNTAGTQREGRRAA
jgi:hypothetical protein